MQTKSSTMPRGGRSTTSLYMYKYLLSSRHSFPIQSIWTEHNLEAKTSPWRIFLSQLTFLSCPLAFLRQNVRFWMLHKLGLTFHLELQLEKRRLSTLLSTIRRNIALHRAPEHLMVFCFFLDRASVITAFKTQMWFLTLLFLRDPIWESDMWLSTISDMSLFMSFNKMLLKIVTMKTPLSFKMSFMSPLSL